MNVDERLDLFDKMTQCNYTVYRRSYDIDFNLIYTNCPPEDEPVETASLMDFSTSLRKLGEQNANQPVLIDSIIGAIWVADFEWKDGALYRYHLLGPVFNGKNSMNVIKEELDRRSLSVKLRVQIFSQIESIAIIPYTIFNQYINMFHYCLTEEKLTEPVRYFNLANEGDYSMVTTADKAESLDIEEKEHRGIYYAEQKLLQMFREGNPNFRDALRRSSGLSYGVKIDIGNALRQTKDSVITLLVLISRAAIEGGLNPAVSYNLQDYYLEKIEQAQTPSDIDRINNLMMEEYITNVQDSKRNSDISKPIQNCCDYISIHIKENISIDDLASQVGYTAYYFSHKFKKEVGISVKEYIKNQKLEQAKLLLSTTQMNVQDICDELSFGTRSFFSVSFHDYTGMSPSEFRQLNAK